MTPMRQGPLSVALGLAAAFAFGAGFLTADLIVDAVGGT
jgi:hypothetical protein